MNHSSWAVVMTVDEPAQLVLANVAWHLFTGASEVHVYLDRPDDPVCQRLSDIAGVVVTKCDDAHWNNLTGNGRPPLQMRRQSLNANHAQTQSKADWMVHCDADEFLWQHRPLADELPYVWELDAELSFPVWERFYPGSQPSPSIFDGGFRSSTKGETRFDRTIFGAQKSMLINGVLGHSAGKCAVPVGRDFSIGIHWSFRGDAKDKNRAERFRSKSTSVLHFDGLTPLHWLIKILRYAEHEPEDLKRLIGPERQAQVQYVLTVLTGARDLMSAHDDLRVLDKAQIKRLNGFGLLEHAEFDPAPAIDAILGKPLDLSPDAFDAALTGRYPDFAEIILGSLK